MPRSVAFVSHISDFHQLWYKMINSTWNHSCCLHCIMFLTHQTIFSVSIATECVILVSFWQSDCFYNGGWTEDVREVITHLHHRYPKTTLFCIGTSIGANIVVCIFLLGIIFFPPICMFHYLNPNILTSAISCYQIWKSVCWSLFVLLARICTRLSFYGW